MPELLLNPHTKQQLTALVASRPSAILISGSAGAGKFAVATKLAEGLLGLPPGQLQHYSYAFIAEPEGGSIGIDAIRQLEHNLSLKVPSASTLTTRVAVIKDSHLMTQEAQNALLKRLEESPGDTAIILTATSPAALLPTVRSRLQTLAIAPPDREELISHFEQLGFSRPKVEQAYLLSGGLPGLTLAICSEDESHELVQAAQAARKLLSEPRLKRLAGVDALAKLPDHGASVLELTGRMARTALANPTLTRATAQRWQKIQAAAYNAGEALAQHAQPKLAWTTFLLSF